MKAPTSLRWQLQRYYFLILFIILAILSLIAADAMRETELYKYDSQLRNLEAPILPISSGRIEVDPSLLGKVPERRGPRTPTDANQAAGLSRNNQRQQNISARDQFLENYIEQGWWFATWNPNGVLIMSSRNAPERPMPDVEINPTDQSIIRDHLGYRELIARNPRMLSVIAYPKTELDQQINRDIWIIVGINSLILITSTAIGWYLIGRALKPLKAIQDTTTSIAKGELNARIPVRSNMSNEINDLTVNLNTTFEKLEGMFERQARFTSDVSHELRTPIAVILNHCQHGLTKERDLKEYRNTLHACQRAGERMKSLTENLLELAKIESGEINLERAPCSLGEIAEEALDLVDPLAARKGVILKNEAIDLTVNINGDRIWQVIVNLLNNAIRHTPEEKAVTLNIKQNHRAVTISIIDEGEGIPADEISSLFSRFYRVDKSRARNEDRGGFGLGLAICKTIIEAHGGKISVESTPGIRTCFAFNLPI